MFLFPNPFCFPLSLLYMFQLTKRLKSMFTARPSLYYERREIGGQLFFWSCGVYFSFL